MKRTRCLSSSLLLALAAALIATGCGYRLAGKSTLDPRIRVIVVKPFENKTTRTEIEQRVTEAVAQELNKRKHYSVGNDPASADAVLEGAITSYLTTPVQFTSAGRATRVEASVLIRAVLRDTANDEVLWSQSGLVFKEQFDVPDTGEFFDQESIALDDIATGAAGVLVTSIFEGF